ncbi:MAG: D-aminoacyl-tRNA deacylase [Bacillota bacterium]|uniref:D-aminoacyl-tRNA deacylase n=1 Tax=[Clostridium] aminophilum TaxID=1526 RepID=A0A1I6ICJ4_9FIRM|nr:D-aminoacyl-tRNA deacylase [[Clostridium] aminophilum]MCR4628261.1 D-tyrosyl-tRNA(Tyr) deacylase [Clostridium sp.]MDT3842980.1 D-aminoacyl-tRNA deacylase [Bacillota bacterium]SFR64505.1 D-tyrosyl-tRNA(Tyr) deacylase [[Clostridium] aminophilum]
MRIVLQVVKHADVKVDGEEIGSIGRGFLILLGVEDTDTEELTDRMIDKVCKLRILSDENDKTNLSLADVGGEILVVSQFTLYADCRKGHRPGFTHAGKPDLAERLYEHAIERCRMYSDKVAHGKFGEHMEVSLLNDGPFTLMLDSDTLLK